MTLDRQNRTWFHLVVLISPLVLVRIVAIVAGAELRGASAQTPSPPDTSGMPVLQQRVADTPTAEQSRALDRRRSLMQQPLGASPFFRARAGDDDEPSFKVSQGPPFAVSAIMVTSSGNTALINGQLQRVGDTIAPGWVIIAIDNDRHAVTAGNDSIGEQIIGYVDLPDAD